MEELGEWEKNNFGAKEKLAGKGKGNKESCKREEDIRRCWSGA